jgi:hypothetical protein
MFDYHHLAFLIAGLVFFDFMIRGIILGYRLYFENKRLERETDTLLARAKELIKQS